jgi:hypothetical protein
MPGRLLSTAALLLALLAEADVGSAYVSSYGLDVFNRRMAMNRNTFAARSCRPGRKFCQMMGEGGDAADSALWASLKKRIGSDSTDSLTLPTADKMV